MAEVKTREGVQIIKLCDKMIKAKDEELKKINKRLEKDLKLSVSRGKTGNHRGALLGVKSMNRGKSQAEKVHKVKAFLQQTAQATKEVLIKGKKNPSEMCLPTDIEQIKKEVNKIEKESDLQASASTSAGSDLDSAAFLKDLLEGDAGESYLLSIHAS